jgi:hypothetical protein
MPKRTRRGRKKHQDIQDKRSHHEELVRVNLEEAKSVASKVEAEASELRQAQQKSPGLVTGFIRNVNFASSARDVALFLATQLEARQLPPRAILKCELFPSRSHHGGHAGCGLVFFDRPSFDCLFQLSESSSLNLNGRVIKVTEDTKKSQKASPAPVRSQECGMTNWSLLTVSG